MKSPPKPRLKVFQAQLGFYDSVVAAPSQTAALRAWGIHQNLFATGDASVTTDPAAVTAALAHPEVPLRRAVGSGAPFEVESTSLPAVPDAPKRRARTPPRPQEAPPPPADRSKLNKAEAALHTLDQRRTREEAAFRREEEELEKRRSAAQAAYGAARKAATVEIAKAREAYRKAGGRD